jgi:triacylglycerol lipase
VTWQYACVCFLVENHLNWFTSIDNAENVGYSIIKPLDGDNDGLVATSAMAWGNYLGTLTALGKRGISHGDMIDLTRKNIYGFDVCEFYVNLVKELKDRGL